MYLKKLELNGFKSFADKTELKVLPGINAIVGPNGCGKTNIVDAISWVLGEQRVRVLRGYKMEDVIFSGAAGRQPIGMAEVSLTFDNTDGQLPLDFSEVTVTRRVFRSGESEYLINKKTCRLRDINELILNTGLGNRSYAMVEQGRVDQILRARPEERRALLEEAAGISKYREKKEEALRKLEITQNNLLRVEDIIKEVKRQLTVVGRQSRQAERYRQYQDRVRDLEVQLNLIQLGQVGQQLRELSKKKHEWQEKYRSLEKEVEEAENVLASSRAQRREKEETLVRLKAERIGKQAEIDKARHRVELNADRSKELQYQRERIKREIEDMANSLAEGQGELQELQKSWKETKESNKQTSTRLQEKEETLIALRHDLSEAEKHLTEARSRSLEFSRQGSQEKNELLSLEAGGKELVLRQRKLEVELEKIKAEEYQLRSEIEEATPLCQESEGEVQALREELKRQKESARELEEKNDFLAKQKEELSLVIREKEAQKKLLQRGEEDSISLIVKAARSGEYGLTGVIGPVADLIDPEPGFEKAVQAALGERLRALVVQGWTDAVNSINFLKARKAGAIRLIVLEAVKNSANLSAKLERSGQGEAGIIKYVKLTPPLTGLERVLLQDAILVKDISRFFETKRGKLRNIFVSQEGEAVSPSGVIYWIGGQGSEKENKLEGLMEELKILQTRIKEVRAKEGKCLALFQEVKARVEQISQSLHREEMKGALSKSELERRQKNLERVGLGREAIESELSSLRKEQRNALGHKKGLEMKLEESTGQEQAMEENIKLARDHVDKTDIRTRNLEAEVTDLKISLASSREREDAIDGRLRQLTSEITKLENLLETRRGQTKESLNRERGLEQDSKNLCRESEKLGREVDELDKQIRALESEISSLNLHCEKREKIYQEVRPRFQDVQTHLSSQDVQLTEWRLKREGLCQKMREKYGIELESMEPPSKRIDPENLALDLERVRKKIEGITNVNLAALSDKENYENRLKLMTEQKDDLEAARRHIEEAIKKINVTARRKLHNTYELVRENFRNLFRQLFEGGKADLILDNEADILEAGLEIVAQPPGKRLSHISLLSGGEKALTTIALIFSLFKVQPSPFYVLDEIDAPLDEANIGRFVQLLKNLVRETQLIIITHSKRTISEADILYGITMEESGVSQVVSVRLAQH